MVAQFANDIKRNAATDISLGTRKRYEPELQAFAKFALWLDVPLPEDIFSSRSSIEDIHQVLLSYALYLRRHGESRTRDMFGKTMPMQSDTITSKISALIHEIAVHDPDLGAILKRHKDHPTALTAQLASMKQDDHLLRGEKDRYRKLPAGMEFIMATLNVIKVLLPPDIQRLYSVTILFEYGFGGRTYQTLVRPGHAHLPHCPPDNEDYMNQSTLIEQLEQSASIHSVKNSDITFNYLRRQPQRFYTLNQARDMPDEPPDSISVYGTQKQHQSGVEYPSTIFQNPHLEGSAPVCLVKEMHKWVRVTPNRAANDFVFIGAHDSLVNKIIKETAKAVGYDPARTFISSIRIGCASASTTGIFDMSQQIIDQLVQHYQQWKCPSGPGPYRITQLDEGLIKTIQLYHLGTTSIAYVIARFIERFKGL